MSGGYFNYKQYHIGNIADSIKQVIETNNSNDKDEWGDLISKNLSPEIIEKFKEAYSALRQAEIYVQRIDWLLSGDDDENSFLTRLTDDLSELNEKNF